MADTYDVSQGDVTVTAAGDTQTVTGYNSDTQQNVVDYTDPDPVITGTSTGADAHTVTITAEAGATANVTFQDLNIDTREDPTVSYTGGPAAVSVSGNVTIELDNTDNNTNTLTSGFGHAGLEKQDDGKLTIQDANGDGGSLTASGGAGGAGIGGGAVNLQGEGGQGTDITVSGSAQVSAAGGAEDAWGFGTGAAIGNTGEENLIPGAEAEDTGELHTDALTCGSITYYDPGTAAADIKNGTAAPSANYDPNPVTGSGHVPGEAVEENRVEAQVGVAGGYDLVVYCADCGEELSREHVVIPALPEPEAAEPEEDAFAAACFDLARRIREAPEKGTVEADMRLYPGLSRAVLEALRDRPDVTLTVTCRLNRAATELVIPAGLDLVTPLGRGFSLTFAEIAKLIG